MPTLTLNDQPMSKAIAGLTLNYRQPDRTVACVHSLLDDGVTHVLIWDNSEDEGISAKRLKIMFSGDIRVSIVVSPINLGFAAGVNRGLEWLSLHLNDSWVLLINNDARLQSGGSVLLEHALRSNPKSVIAYPVISNGGMDISMAYYQPYLGLITVRPVPGSIPYASGCCLLIATDRFTGTLMDESFFMYGEDVELGYRLGRDGMSNVPKVLVWHEGSASSGMGTAFYETRMVAAHWQLASKLSKGRIEFGLSVLGRAVVLPLRGLVRAWRYRSWVPIQALWWGLCLAVGSDSMRQRAQQAPQSD